MTEADGTRRALVSTSTNNYDTIDGSNIHFTIGTNSRILIYPDGTRVAYGASGGGYRSFPTRITDRNGNYIDISYVTGIGPKIDSVKDTLARYVTFAYAANGDLISISATGTGTQPREVMRFFYEDMDLTDPNNPLFSSNVNVTLPPNDNAHVLKYVFLSNSVEASNPHIGYRFDYSAYGMIYQISQFRGMTLNSGGTSVEGDGTLAAITTYNYEGTPVGLSDVPSFTTRTDDWAGRTTSGNAPSYTFSNNETTGISTVTAPDGSVMESHAIVNPDVWDNGLIKHTYIDKNGSSALSHTEIDWEQGPNGIPRMSQMRVTNDGGQTKATVFSYTTYNNIETVSERDFTLDGSVSATELRRTHTTYVTSTAYTSRYLVSLPETVKVFPQNSSTPSARVDYAYDNYGTNHANLTARNDIIMHDPAFDPFQQTQETNCDWVCAEYDEFSCIDWDWVCEYVNPYQAATDYRGNVTSVTTYPDANNTGTGITHDTTYDIAGNVITEELDCCQQKSITYSGAGTGGDHDYAYPITVTIGSGATTLTTSSEYNYNTGLLDKATDENTLETNHYYHSDSLRLNQTTYPGGGVTSYSYSDGLSADGDGRYHFYVKTSTKLDAPGGTPRWVESFSFLDGRGAVGARSETTPPRMAGPRKTASMTGWAAPSAPAIPIFRPATQRAPSIRMASGLPPRLTIWVASPR